MSLSYRRSTYEFGTNLGKAIVGISLEFNQKQTLYPFKIKPIKLSSGGVLSMCSLFDL